MECAARPPLRVWPVSTRPPSPASVRPLLPVPALSSVCFAFRHTVLWSALCP
jgi:hypothetical protein